MTSINLKIKKANAGIVEVPLQLGEKLFVVGANGTGKSSLLQSFFTSNSQIAKRIAAHRQTWLEHNTVNITTADRISSGNNINSTDSQATSRYNDPYSAIRPRVALYDLVQEQNRLARNIAEAAYNSDLELVKELSKFNAPITAINELMKLSGLPIEIYMDESEQLLAKRAGGVPYSIAQLSDGERNALLVASDVLTAKSGALILIDEPERHLHRSIISPLLLNMFAMRADCYFVISSHDLTLMLDSPAASVVLVRDCVYQNNEFKGWDFDCLPPGSYIDDETKTDILGARKKVIFVEGTENSLDKALYSLIFPDISIVAKDSCTKVEQVVRGIRSEPSLTWLDAYGIVDNDRRPQAQIDNFARNKIYALNVYSVEGIYYHPEMQRRLLEKLNPLVPEASEEVIARRSADIVAKLDAAKVASLRSVHTNIDKFSQWVAEKKIREQVFASLPTRASVATLVPINLEIDVSAEVTKQKVELERLHTAGEIAKIIENYPVKESAVLQDIATKIGLQTEKEYEQAVRDLLMTDALSLAFVKGLFGALLDEIEPRTTEAEGEGEHA